MADVSAENGALTNHDRNTHLNGANGAGPKLTDTPNGTSKQTSDGGDSASLAVIDPTKQTFDPRRRMNDLPEEIVHIADGYIPLSILLSRLAQQTHNVLQEKVQQLARMPLPPAPAMNGNSSAPSKDEFDNSHESLSKKVNLLSFIQRIHGKWVKALVIANWSRESERVTKLIDLKSHLNNQLMQFDLRLDQVVELKRGLIFARVPSPDLKTALQVLSCGNGDWMPDLGYIEPPALKREDHVKWLEELDTCLSMRLNLHDYDKIPPQFKDYSIGSGRVTFSVKGEFEVDLTVADEDPEKQFWFIDFRFDFSPVAHDLTARFRPVLESHVNNALAKDNLTGCYQLLHGFVLTHKISELRRQAYELARTSWTRTLVVEQLDRAFSIQYWVTRQPQVTSSVPAYSRYAIPQVPTVPKSWIIVSAVSARRPDGNLDPKASSRLAVKWFRDGKEVKDVEIEFDQVNLSTEKLLKVVIAKHVEHILRSIHKKLRPAPRFAGQEAAMALRISASDAGESFLTMQLSATETVTLTVEPTSGKFNLHPNSKFTMQAESRLNMSGKDPAEDGAPCLETLRWHHLAEEIARKGRSQGWTPVKSPLSHEDVKALFKPQEQFSPVCFQRQGVDTRWYVMLVMSLHGDEWWVFRSDVPKATARSVKFFSKLRLQLGQPGLERAFWNNLTMFVTAVISHATDLAELHHNRFRYEKRANKNFSLPNEVVIPSIFIKLSDILPTAADQGEYALTLEDKHHRTPQLHIEPSKDGTSQSPTNNSDMAALPKSGAKRTPPGTRKPWAADFVELRYSGVQSIPSKDSASARQLTCSMDAIVRVLDRKKFSLLSGKLGHQVYYNPGRGEFCIRLRTRVGTSIVRTLTTRLQAIDRVVDSLDAMRSTKGAIKCEQVTLEKVIFTYTDAGGSDGAKRWRVSLDLSTESIAIDLEMGNPHLRVIDHLTSLVNAPGGISHLTLVLPMSLTILTILDKIQNAWKEIAKHGKGALIITPKALDWITLCYELPETPNRPRSVRIDVRARIRNGKLWWFVRRSDQEEQDFFAQRLRKVWEARNVPWRSLSSGAATHIDDRSLKLLIGLDQTVREAVLGTGTGPNAAANNAQASVGRVNAQAGTATTGGAAVGSRAKPVTLD
ncbi:hypothetical protein jhhlp_007111 [Lomentospora prolificans]|uniref:Mediator of RNA polymerase II transcription subunit 14 n=1 Tax=Lomentospora prolificans TaxID=41688 RepID=A0A2N3N1R8_9PEZI|nr:hypothetical protein jhhlp_007111 [Lomentospora prolificans]